MIYAILLIIFIAILATTKSTLNRHYGKISDNPLRKKIVDDTINFILFTIVFWCMLQTHSKKWPIVSLLIISILLVLFAYRKTINQSFLNIMSRLQDNFTFFALLNIVQKKSLKKDKNSNAPNNQRTAVYKEHIMLTVIFFCKRAVIAAIVILAILKIAQFTNPGILNIVTNEIASSLNTLTKLFIIINNIGLAFTYWKFDCDYKAIGDEHEDNPRYLDIIKRMLRKEHEI